MELEGCGHKPQAEAGGDAMMLKSWGALLGCLAGFIYNCMVGNLHDALLWEIAAFIIVGCAPTKAVTR